MHRERADAPEHRSAVAGRRPAANVKTATTTTTTTTIIIITTTNDNHIDKNHNSS